MKKIVAHKDLGKKETYELWNGKFLDENAYDKVLHVTENTGVMKPIKSLDGSDVPLAYVITDVYPQDNKIRTPNSYYVRTKSGGWGMIAYSNEIHSVMIGYKRGRFTGGIDVSGW